MAMMHRMYGSYYIKFFMKQMANVLFVLNKCDWKL